MLSTQWNAFHVPIVVIVLQYLLIQILIVLLEWMIAFIMDNVETLHANTVLRKKVFLVCIACLANNSSTSINGSTTGVTKSMKTATKHAKSKQHISCMKYWKKQLLMQEQQILYPTDASFDNEVMNEPSSFEPSENHNIPQTFLPGHT